MSKAMENYRKTLIPMQTGILIVCGVLAWKRMPLLGVVWAFLVMQVFSLLGAMWGARLQRKAERHQERRNDDLPRMPRML